jgi:hypothetical protein
MERVCYGREAGGMASDLGFQRICIIIIIIIIVIINNSGSSSSMGYISRALGLVFICDRAKWVELKYPSHLDRPSLGLPSWNPAFVLRLAEDTSSRFAPEADTNPA